MAMDRIAHTIVGADATDLMLDMPSSSRGSKLDYTQDYQLKEVQSWFESSVEELFTSMKPTLPPIGGRPISAATGEAQLIYGSGSDMLKFKRHKHLWLCTISLQMLIRAVDVLILLTIVLTCFSGMTRKYVGDLTLHHQVQIISTGQLGLMIYCQLSLLWNTILTRRRGRICQMELEMTVVSD